MPPRAKKPSKDEIKRAADRAEGKKPKPEKASPLDPPSPDDEPDEFDELVAALGLAPLPRRKPMRTGRPTKYRPEYARIAAKLLSTGSTVPELAEAFGISERTVWLWRSTHADFMQAFMQSTEDMDERVERALGQRAVGYTYDEPKVFVYNGELIHTTVRKHMPADVGAQKFWLSARQSGKWRVKEEVEISASGAVFSELWKQLADKKNKE